jgi:hypothetical protein
MSSNLADFTPIDTAGAGDCFLHACLKKTTFTDVNSLRKALVTIILGLYKYDEQIKNLINSHAVDENISPNVFLENLNTPGVFFGLEGAIALSILIQRPVTVFQEGLPHIYNPCNSIEESIFILYDGGLRGHFTELQPKGNQQAVGSAVTKTVTFSDKAIPQVKPKKDTDIFRWGAASMNAFNIKLERDLGNQVVQNPSVPQYHLDDKERLKILNRKLELWE